MPQPQLTCLDGTPLLGPNHPQMLLGPTVEREQLLPRSTHPDYAGYGTAPFMLRAEDVFRNPIPRGEWADIIDYKWAHESWPMCYRNWKCRSQDRTSSCWGQGPCTAFDIKRAQQGLPFVETSGCSVTSKVTGFRDVGGWGLDAVKYMVEHGCVASRLWPNSAISKKYDTAESEADREHRRVLEWVDLPTRDLQWLFTYVANDMPCPVGYDRWRHEVCAVAFKKVGTGADAFPYACNPSVATVISNSWQNAEWGYPYKASWWQQEWIGFGNLDESWLPDDAQALRSVTSYPD